MGKVAVVLGFIAGLWTYPWGCTTKCHLNQSSIEAVLKTDIQAMRRAISDYTLEHGHGPRDLDALVSEGYLRRLPTDPITRSADTWVIEYADGSSEITDIRSAAPGAGSDGTAYATW